MSDALDRSRIAVLVHEVRSPVAALGAIAETVRGRDLDTDTRRELMRLAVAACRGIERVVGDVSVTSVRLVVVDPEALVRDVVSAARVRGDRVAQDIDGPLPSIDGDPSRLRQALDNLIANALTHSGEAVVTIRARVDANVLRISVLDTGVGIPRDAQSTHPRGRGQPRPGI